MIVTKAGKTHVAYLNARESIVVRSRDNLTGKWTPEVVVGAGQDNHGAPSLVIDSQGYLHLIFGPHHGQFRYLKSIRPNDTSAWTPVFLFAESGTYSSVVVDQYDTLHIVYRGGYSSEALTYQTRTKEGKWSNPRDLVNGNSTGHIVSYNDMLAIGSDQSLHITYNFFTGWTGGIGQKVGYLRSTDFGKTWQDVAGSSKVTPVDFNSTPVVSDRDGANYRSNFVIADAAGNGYVAVSDVNPGTRFELVKFGRDGKTTRLNLSNLLSSDLLFDAGAVPSISADHHLWIAASYAPKNNGGWASPQTAIALISIDLARFDMASVKVVGNLPALRTPGSFSATDTQPTWLPSLERFTGQNEMSAIPKLMFTSGPANRAGDLGTAQATRIFFSDVNQYLKSQAQR